MNIKVQIEELSPCERSLRIEVPFEELEKEMQRQFDSLSKRVTLPGFRAGKVPRDLIEQKYDGEVRKEALSRVVETSYVKAVSDHQVMAVSEPKFTVEPLKDREPISYSAHVEVKPKIELKKYVGLSLEMGNLREQIRKEFAAYEEERVRQGVETEVVRELVHQNPVAVAPSMIQRQSEFLEKDLGERLRKTGLEGEKLSEMIEKNRSDIQSRAQFDIQAMLLLEAVAEKEKMEISAEELEKEYEQIAKRANAHPKEVRAYFEKEEGRGSQLRWQLLQQKVIQWLISKAKVTESAGKGKIILP